MEQGVVDDAETGNTENAQDAQPETLDSILSEFDAGDNPQPEPTPKAEDTDLATEFRQLKAQVEAEREERTAENIKAAVSETVAAVKSGLEDLPFVPTDKMIEGRLGIMAREDPRIEKAFDQRHSNPSGWQKVLEGVRSEIRKEIESQPDTRTSQDIDAMTAAVRGASTAAKRPEAAPDFSGMSNAEYRKKVEKEWGYSPRV